MSVDIPHITTRLDDNTPGQPGWGTVRTADGKLCKPIIRCNCGRWVGIGLHHVHSDGTVTASFYHQRGNIPPADTEGCEWHVHIKLLDYDLGDFPPEK